MAMTSIGKGTLDISQETSPANRTLVQMGHWGHWRGARSSQLSKMVLRNCFARG